VKSRTLYLLAVQYLQKFFLYLRGKNKTTKPQELHRKISKKIELFRIATDVSTNARVMQKI